METLKIKEIRETAINYIARERPNLAEIVLTENYLITSIKVSDGNTQEIYTILDFTSKQQDHLHDFEDYTVQLYNGFNKPFYMC